MSQLAVLFACQIPFRFGLPSESRGMALAGACARGIAVATVIAAIAPAANRVSNAGFFIFASASPLSKRAGRTTWFRGLNVPARNGTRGRTLHAGSEGRQ